MMSYAFFDVDGTLLKFTSMTDFYRFAEARGSIQPSLVRLLCKAALKHGPGLIARNTLNAIYYRQFAGCRASDIEKVATEWFEELQLRDQASVWNKAVIDLLRWHQLQQHNVVLVSGSFRACLDPISRHLGVADVLCVNPKIAKGRYTGTLLPPQTIGEGKAKAIRAFLSTRPDGAHAPIWAYGDHISDLPMLQIATTPVVVAGDSQLEAYANKYGWARI